MKRKLNDRDAPEAVSSDTKPEEKKPEAVSSFTDLNLDSRLLQAITKQEFSRPTSVQSAAIPLALSGRDILARAKTGSGKTAAYTLPLLHKILRSKNPTSGGHKTAGLILVPTRELAAQVTKAVVSFSAFCGGLIRTENVTRKEDEKVLRARLADAPDVVVATPGRANALVEAGVLDLEGLLGLVVDEADLVLSYGHDEDLKALANVVPRGVQTVLMSATLRAEVEELKTLFCNDPVVLELDETEKEDRNLKQYVVKCGEDEKFLLIYAIFMLKLIKGKVIVFVADIDRCYRLKMFLEQFGIRSCVLNSELPANSRIHAVEEFNRNVYDIIIASDENEIIGSEEKSSKRRKKDKAAEEEEEEEEATEGAPAENETEQVAPELGDSQPKKKKRRRHERDAEYGISRGIDFKNVSCVLNFDLPSTSKSYTHRIGRTARAGKTGMALSFCIPKTLYRKHKPTSIPSCATDEETLAKISKSQTKRGQTIEPYDFDMKRLDGFRYRMADALRSVTRIAVREARSREIRQELLKSEKLKRHFEENPEDLAALRHDGETHAVRVQQHLKHVPEYLLPGGAKSVVGGDVGFGKIGENRIRAARKRNVAKGRKGKKGKGDPLKSLGRK
ncbi:putative ATP dependent RNA helicase [Myriangium duriaei CBS 260.36]|uniref:RNA helicase n=1 Tax=Myriangium duriaei CBS 260.36 TaxID=1168546 RepID=A0A9P4J5F8_9PEZI|nr:putative ATP dependent RNA helicase [Myriangium duriaei CBS 260.36]